MIVTQCVNDPAPGFRYYWACQKCGWCSRPNDDRLVAARAGRAHVHAKVRQAAA